MGLFTKATNTSIALLCSTLLFLTTAESKEPLSVNSLGFAQKSFVRLQTTLENQLSTLAQNLVMPPASCILLQNPGFDSNLSQWTKYGSPSGTNDSYSGNWAANLSSFYTYIIQSQNGITPGRVYNLSVYGKVSGNPYWALAVMRFKDSGNNILTSTTIDISSSSYEKYYLSLTAPSNATAVEVYALKYGNSGWLRVDEFCLEETNPAIGECTLAINPDFEDGQRNWTTSGGTVSITSDASSGVSAVQVESDGASIYQRLGVFPNQTYELAAWAKVSSNAPSYAEIFIEWRDINGNLIHSVVQPVIATTTEYALFSLKGKAPSNAAYADIGAYKTGSSSRRLYFDDVCFSKTNALGGSGFSLSCGCSSNLLPNAGFEELSSSSFPYTMQGVQAAAISNGNNSAVSPWQTSISSNYAFVLNDNNNTVNNPEGNRFVWLPNKNDGWYDNVDFSNNLLMEDGKTYTLCFYAASWVGSLNSSGLPNGGTATQIPGVVTLGFNYQSGYQTIATWSVPASASFSNLSWTKYSYTFTYDGGNPIQRFLLLNDRSGAGIALDGVNLSEVDCETKVACGTGAITYERWYGIGSDNLYYLITNPDFPNNYDETGTLPSFQSPANFADNYGTRAYGYLIPSQTGNYTFNVTSDDYSRFYLSTDSSEQNKILRASVTGWTNITEYTKYSSQTSSTISLVAGKKYFIELLHKEGGGLDHFQVYWKTPSNSSWTIIPGSVLSPICRPEICGNGIDDDNDGLVDCDDPDCSDNLAANYTTVNENCGSGGGAIDLKPNTQDAPLSFTWSDMPMTAWWTFEGTTDDVTGNVHHENGISGSLSYTNDAVEGKKSVYFNGSSYIRYSVDNGFMEKAFSELTIAMWIKPNNLSGIQTLFDEGGSTGGKGLAIRLTNNILTAGIKQTSTLYSDATHVIPNDGAWHHVAVVFDNGQFTAYLDGVPSPTITTNFTQVTNHGNNGGLGASVGGSVLNGSGTRYAGKMDDVRYFFNQALTPDQVKDMARNDGDRTNLYAGTYTVQVYSASGCSTTQTIYIASNANHNNGGLISGNETSCLASYNAGLISSIAPPSGGGTGTTQYQWQSSTDNGVTWADIPGANSLTYDPGTITTTTLYRRGGRLAPCLAWVYSDVATKTFTTNYTDGGTVTGNESFCGAFNPALISSTSVPSGGSGGNSEYQWQLSYDTLVWSNIAGASGATYDPPNITQTTLYRRAARRAPCLSYVYSDTITKMVVYGFTNPGIIAGDESVCGSYDPDLISSVTAPSGGADGTLQYQWQQKTTSGSWVTIAGANAETLNPTTIIETTQYRRGARRSPCTAYIYSNEITKSVVSNYTFGGIISGDQAGCGSYDPYIISSFSPPAGGIDGSLTYQWQQSTDGGTSWTVVPGAAGASYDPGIISQTTIYRRQARRAPCAAWINSNTVIKTVKVTPNVTMDSMANETNGYICEWFSYTFQAADLGAGAIYSWDFGAYANPATATGTGPHTVVFNVPGAASYTSNTVTLTGTIDGCSNTISQNYKIRPQIVITSLNTEDPGNCGDNNGKIEIQTLHPSGTNVEASIDGGATWDGGSIEFDNLSAGTYEILLRYAGSECEYNWGSVTLTDPGNLTADVTLSATEICQGQTFTVQATATSGVSPNFAWFFGLAATPVSANGPGPHTVSYSDGGVKDISLTISENFCTGYVDTVITIVSTYTAGGTISGNEDLCSPGPGTIMATAAQPSGGFGGTAAYQWEYSEDDGSGGWTAWSDVAGANNETYAPPFISKTTKFRRKARRSPCSNYAYSNEVTKRMSDLPMPVDDLFDTACPGFFFFDYVSLNDGNLSNPVYSIVVPPLNGLLDLDADGEFVYTPNSFFCGTDQFTYQVCNNGTSCCATAVATIDLTDAQVPVLQNIPANLLVSCDDEIPLAPIVDAWENCQTVTLGMDEASDQGLADSCSVYSYSMTRTWTAGDYCGNSASAQQTLTIQDFTSPDIYRIYTLPNGRKMVAGVMENVSDRWKTIRFPVQFASKPVVFSQIVTNNEAVGTVVRMRNISTSQFQLRLQEEEAADNVHALESVAWMAIEEGPVTGTLPYEVGNKLVSSSNATVNFDQPYSNPGLIASIQSFNENNPVSPRIRSMNSVSAVLFCQEEQSFDPETNHGFETMGYMAFDKPGDITNQQGEVIGETGRLTLNHNFATVNLLHTYHNPVVIMGGITFNGSQASTLRVKDVTANAFSVRIDEWEYLDDTHVNEQVTYMVVEGSIPFDQVVECSAIPDQPIVGFDIVGMDNCDISTPLTITDSPFKFDCANDTLFSRTFSVQDECGNKTVLTQVFSLRDTTPPTFTVPADVTITCTVPLDSLNAIGDVTDELDNCATNIQATYTDNTTFLNGCIGYIIRTWALSDFCGNTTQHMQTITVYNDNDTDGDGLADPFDLDDDNDGIPDVDEGTGDTDGDGIPDAQDLDSDNDGIPDIIEAGFNDNNGDGVVDTYGQPDWDVDHDGLANIYDGNENDPSLAASDNFNAFDISHDADGDGIPNYIDLDSDNDGIPDLIESGGVDTNGDGVIEYPIAGNPQSLEDADGDGFTDAYDPDDDTSFGIDEPGDVLIRNNNGTFTGGQSSFNPDDDGDGIPNYLDTDSDNDGIADLIEAGGVDTNGDGRIDTNEFTDINQNGFDDTYESNVLISTDSDNGTGDGRPHDDNGDGTAYIYGDADNDGDPNFYDTDSDNDGIYDIVETGYSQMDANHNGRIDVFTDSNSDGFNDSSVGTISTDSDGATDDGRPEDDADAGNSVFNSVLADGTFGETNGEPDLDDDGDNIPNFLDIDSDNDFLTDSVEDTNGNGITDTGETGYLNTDTDNDGILDGLEDSNHDGIYDAGTETNPLDTDTDDDGLDDGVEDANQNGVVDGTGESDPRDPCDPLVNSACIGVSLDIRLNIYGAMIDNNGAPFMKDKLRQSGYIPNIEPYTNLPNFDHYGEGGGEQAGPGVLAVTGSNAVIDWVLVELRYPNAPDQVVATRAALLQMNGRVVDTDGISPVKFDHVPSGDYFVSVRHRSHLGVCTYSWLTLSPTTTTIDFTTPATHTYGSFPQIDLDNVMALWPGNMNNDNMIIYQGPSNEIVSLFFHVMTNPENSANLANFISQGYWTYDINMDGAAIFQGPNNDRAKVLINSILLHPNNTNFLANFILFDQLP
ncbi:MAG: LamG-like jellyroll fold domain-containing protein [Saprospiraceae bacterium]